MACLICGCSKTVRSHILPKALALDIRDGSKHVIQGSRFHKGAKPSQGGAFSDGILCTLHEQRTAALDTYGVEFIRRAASEFERLHPERSFQIANPQPNILLLFALSIVWRELAYSRREGERGLGKYREPIENAIFADGAFDAPMLIARTRFRAGSGDPIKIGVHPHPIRMKDRNVWSMTLAGFSFYPILDGRGMPMLPDWLRANQSDPIAIVVGHWQDLDEVGILKPILANMRSKPGPVR